MNDKRKIDSSTNQTRRSALKSLVVTAGSITFVKSDSAQANTNTIPSIISLLLDDTVNSIQLEPNSDGSDQLVAIPDGATEMDIITYGGGGAGSATPQASGESIFIAGGNGGDGGAAQGRFDLTGISSLKVQVGEGGQAGETTEPGVPGEFGGAAGGLASNTSSVPTGAYGAAGGGYSAVFTDDDRLLIAAGGGGGAGGSGGYPDTFGGRGGAGGDGEEQRNGEDGFFSADGSAFVVGKGGTTSVGGVGPSFAEGSVDGIDSSESGSAGAGGNTSSERTTNSGGAGGGGGGSIVAEVSEGLNSSFSSSGSGGGAGIGDSNEDAGAGGGGAGGANFLVDANVGLISGSVSVNDDLSQGGKGGEGGSSASNGESGAPGRVQITFY